MPSTKFIIDEIKAFGDELKVDLWYPRSPDTEIKSLRIGLMDVRCADDIRVSYDFDRDGWKVEQASVFEWEPEDKVCDMGWKEVAFVQAWGSKKEETK